MKIAQIRNMDISNGEEIGISLFVQGCPLHCKGCFNQETWDFNSGTEWTEQLKKDFLSLAGKPYIKRISILGGEPLCDQNCYEIFNLCRTLKNLYPNKKIWIYSGYTYEKLLAMRHRFKPLLFADVLVDGKFQEELKNVNLKWRGSSNQRIIDIPASLKENILVPYNFKP